MKLLGLAALAAFLTTVSISASPISPNQRQIAFEPHSHNLAYMDSHFTFDSGAQGAPELSDIIAKERGATIAMDAILQNESLVRAISGSSADFKDGLTLLLPTNKAFQSLDSVPEDLELVMQRHFIPRIVTPKDMQEGITVYSHHRSALLRFTSSSGKVYVQADTRKPTEVVGTGTHAGSGSYFLVNDLFV